jgi:hypothetical protein
VDSAGRLVDEKGPTIADVPVDARSNPHVTLHRSGVCHIRARGQEPVVRVPYGAWCPPSKELEWLYLYSDPVAVLPETPKAGPRDAVAPFARPTHSAVLRVDVLPRTGNAVPLLGGSLHTVVGFAPEYAVRASLFEHGPVRRRILIATHQRKGAAG